MYNNSRWRWSLALAGVLAVVAVGVLAVQHFSSYDNDNGTGNGGGAPPRQPGFREAAVESGITFRMNFLPSEQGENFKTNLYDHGCGVVIGDFDGDGHDDVYFVNQLGRNALYKNKGDGTFIDVTEKAGVGLGDRICVGAVFGDYDRDGRLDLFVTSTRGGNVLFHNEGKDKFGNVKFKDVTDQAKVAPTVPAHSQTAVFFDYDNDGWPDLYVTNTAKWTTDQLDPGKRYFFGKGKNLFDLLDADKEDNVFYRNNGDGTFTDVTAKTGLKGKGWGGDVVVFDYDLDGWLDLLVTNMFGSSQLYRNNGDGTFSDVRRKVLGKTSMGAIGAKAFDFNNDGLLDVLIADMHSDMWVTGGDAEAVLAKLPGFEKMKFSTITGPRGDLDPAWAEMEKRLADKFGISYADVVFGNTLFQNRGHVRAGSVSDRRQFEEVSAKANMETFWPWGIATGDFNNDGREDVFLPSGMGYPFMPWPNALLMNNGDGTFSDRAKEAGIEPPPGGVYLEALIGNKQAPRSSRCAAVADFDGDGRLDLMVSNFNDRPYYFKNEFPVKNYIAFRLTGTRSSTEATGALVRIYHGKEVQVRQVQAAGGYLSQSSNTVHFGLGNWTRIDRVEIRWPRGSVQNVDLPAINRLYRITETP